MARKKMIGLIVGGIFVAAIIATLVTTDFTETGDPTKITKFAVKKKGETMELSIIVNGTIPYDGKKLPISESVKEFGYAWLRLYPGDHLGHRPNELKGFMASIKPGDDASSPEKWWNIYYVNFILMDPDDPNFCLFSSQKTGGQAAVTENELRVYMFSSQDPSTLPIDRAMVIEIEDDETCLNGTVVHILDTKMN